MSTRVRVGDVEVRVEADLTHRQVRQLLRTCAGIALGLAEATGEPERAPIGFTVITEREPTEMAVVEYDDEE